MRDVKMRGFDRRTPLTAALDQLEAISHRLTPEPVAIAEACGRVAAEEVQAAAAVPHFTRAMMDGYAVVAESTFGASSYQPVTLAVAGAVQTGQQPLLTEVSSQQAVQVTTGAPLPPGADAVVMVEHTTRLEDDTIEIDTPVSPGKHVGQIGEDVQIGAPIVQRGRRLRPQDVGLLASTGVAEIAVTRRPMVAFLATGDELLPPGSKPAAAKIVDTNSLVVRALAERDGARLLPTIFVKDDRPAVRACLRDTAADVLLVSGGSSVGPEDHAPRVLAELGTVIVHGVAMRPASPSGFGTLEVAGQRRLVFLLPGNPVSCHCAYEFFAGPAIRRLGGLPWGWPHRRLATTARGKLVSQLGRTDYVRVILEEGGARALATSGAAILSSTTRADGVVIVPDELEGYADGQPLEVLLYD